MPGSKKSGLLDMLFKDQSGGAAGDGYGWHRSNAINNLSAAGVAKRDAWLDEVRQVADEMNMSWKDALQEASRRRASRSGYQTVKERVIAGYKPRVASQVRCQAGRACPGAYSKPAATTYRPGAHNKRLLSQDAAVKHLRSYYRERGAAAGGSPTAMKNATKAMRQDISRLKRGSRKLTPCPTRVINVKATATRPAHQRRIVMKTPECADNYLYRGVGVRRYDFEGVDDGIGKKSRAYGLKRLRVGKKIQK